ncbi:MAG: hypothetical protein K2O34_07800, partial [Acetatifactor sp.]|nr:hypothetical protein [Acetatifactor sp.]
MLHYEFSDAAKESYATLRRAHLIVQIVSLATITPLNGSLNGTIRTNTCRPENRYCPQYLVPLILQFGIHF